MTLKLVQARENTVDDLQGRLRCNILVFHGKPEGTEADNFCNSCKELINLMLVDLFGMADVKSKELTAHLLRDLSLCHFCAGKAQTLLD